MDTQAAFIDIGDSVSRVEHLLKDLKQLEEKGQVKDMFHYKYLQHEKIKFSINWIILFYIGKMDPSLERNTVYVGGKTSATTV